MVLLTTVPPRKLHRRGHKLAETFAARPVDMYLRAKHRLAGHVALFENDNPVYQMMVCRKLAWWCQEERLWGDGKPVWNERMAVRAWRAKDTRVVGWNAVAQRLALSSQAFLCETEARVSCTVWESASSCVLLYKALCLCFTFVLDSLLNGCRERDP